MPEDAFLPAIGPNEVDVLADKLAHWRAQQAGMLSDQVNVQALVPVRLEARDFLRARPGAIVTEHPLRFVDHDHRAIRQVVPRFGRIELDPLRLEPIQLHIRDAVVVDRPGRQVRIVRVLVQPLGRVIRVRLMFNVDFPNRVQSLASTWQTGAQIEHVGPLLAYFGPVQRMPDLPPDLSIPHSTARAMYAENRMLMHTSTCRSPRT
ncbi:hypothetical protein DR97_6372 [Pseudomonas aeruginosa]|nr:hypothetical protein DR97_6372 [Pseudomonas aeruginosa]